MSARPRRKLSLRQIEAFQAVVLTGSVSKAAQRMHVSQPAVSRLVADLEQAVGFTVFDRGRRFQLTAEGRLLYREVEHSFVGIEKIAQRAEEIGTFRSGHVRIAASPALGLGLLPPVIRSFRATYAEVMISSQVRASQSVAEWVASGQIDVGYAALPVNLGGVTTVPFEPLPVLCLLPRKHSLSRETVITPDMLVEEHLISLGPESSIRGGIDRVFRQVGVPVVSSVETTMSAQAAALVREGLGVTLIDPFTAIASTDREFVLKPFEPAVPYEFAALLPEHITPTRLATEFMSEVKSSYDVVRRQVQALYPTSRSKGRQAWRFA
jgi:DNA-binding transcriptional LysR family regulator